MPQPVSTRRSQSSSKTQHPVERYALLLEQYRHVTDACFGEKLHSDAASRIAAFRATYLTLQRQLPGSAKKIIGLTVSRTLHYLFRHVLPFCEHYKCGLKPFIEETHESLHQDFNRVHSRRTRASSQHPAYGAMLFDALCTYNFLHCSGTPNQLALLRSCRLSDDESQFPVNRRRDDGDDSDDSGSVEGDSKNDNRRADDVAPHASSSGSSSTDHSSSSSAPHAHGSIVCRTFVFLFLFLLLFLFLFLLFSFF